MTRNGPRDAVRLAERVWWVGSHRPEEKIEGNAYLIEQGDQSVLIDPGSRLTFAETLERIEQVVPFSSIRWIVCHHQDPSVTSSLPLIDDLIERSDAAIVCHSNSAEKIVHYALATPFRRVEDHQFRLANTMFWLSG